MYAFLRKREHQYLSLLSFLGFSDNPVSCCLSHTTITTPLLLVLIHFQSITSSPTPTLHCNQSIGPPPTPHRQIRPQSHNLSFISRNCCNQPIASSPTPTLHCNQTIGHHQHHTGRQDLNHTLSLAFISRKCFNIQNKTCARMVDDTSALFAHLPNIIWVIASHYRRLG